jgi:hypothetical protein
MHAHTSDDKHSIPPSNPPRANREDDQGWTGVVGNERLTAAASLVLLELLAVEW